MGPQMSSSYKILGQSIPAATTAATLYTVPSSTSTVVSTISICNQAAASITYRIAVVKSGDTLATKHYVAFGTSLAANGTTFLTLGVTLSAGDSISVYSSTATTSFNAYGVELT
jgi:hypothetical protein